MYPVRSMVYVAIFFLGQGRLVALTNIRFVETNFQLQGFFVKKAL